MESVCGESNAWGYSPTYSSESVGESCADFYQKPSPVNLRPLDTPRITKLRKELAELELELRDLERKEELELEDKINKVKQKVKRYRK